MTRICRGHFVLLFIISLLTFSCTIVGPEEDPEETVRKLMEKEAVPAVTFGTLLDSMTDLTALARKPDPGFTTRQFSSYDRRSRTPGESGWFANADGFGNEEIPGFVAVLREPVGDGDGLYLMASSDKPGAIVRTWSAWINGTVRVYLDGADEPIFDGPAGDFLVRKSEKFLEAARCDLSCGDAFRQQDADYMPIPFSRSLRVTWEGKIRDTHFYHLEVIEYERGTGVAAFSPDNLLDHDNNLRRAVERLNRPACSAAGEKVALNGTIEPGKLWEKELVAAETGGAITELTLGLEGEEIEAALRGTLLSIRFDDASHPQVQAPAGDFFASGPGVNVFNSLPFAVAPDGKMTCRFVMPYQRRAAISLRNTTGKPVVVNGAATVAPWKWDDRSLYFRARWRTDNDLHLMKREVIDMPYVVLRGKGHLVGAAVMVVNPSAAPTPSGNWWGEGDEKIFVDEGVLPSFFGTGSEDYFNYSWSRPDLFDHPYCGQPLDSGPGNLGYVSNHRFHVIDPIPFKHMLAFYMELFHHSPYPGMSYSRIAYLYARPGAIDDHRGLLASDLHVEPLRSNEPRAYGGASNSTFHFFDDLGPAVTGGFIGYDASQPGASRGRLIGWKAEAGHALRVVVPVEKDGKYVVNFVSAHRPGGGSLRAEIDGAALRVRDRGGSEGGGDDAGIVVQRSSHANRLLSMGFEPVELKTGNHVITFVCTEAGSFGFDYLWLKKM